MRPKELSINNEIFTDLRVKMDMALNAVITNLIDKKLGAGKVTAKIGIELFEKTNEETGEIYYDPVFKPEVNISVGEKAKLECSAPLGMVLKKSRCGKNIISSNQISMEDLEEAEKEETA